MNTKSVFYQIIIGSDNPILRKKSEPVQKITSEVLEVADVLLELMYQQEALWLSAPQVNKHLRIATVTQRKDKKKKKMKGWKVKIERDFLGDLVLINPEILDKSENYQVNEEWCLSLPEIYGDVKRFQWIKLKYQNLDWKEITTIIRGWNAVIIQHEIDHLDGILFTDKLVKKKK